MGDVFRTITDSIADAVTWIGGVVGERCPNSAMDLSE
jgi:hypothetical protein